MSYMEEIIKGSKIIVLTGMSCAGKDTIRRELEKDCYGYINIVSHTSRPMRENEIEGVDYHFVSKEQFNDMIDNNEMIEYRNYETNWNGRSDTWFYGVKKFVPMNCYNYVIVMDLMGAESIIRHFGEDNCVLIYLTAPDDERRKRAIRRGSFDETEWNRRLIADYKDFSFANLNSFMHRHKVWQIDNTLNGDNSIREIADVIDFIRWGRLS